MKAKKQYRHELVSTRNFPIRTNNHTFQHIHSFEFETHLIHCKHYKGFKNEYNTHYKNLKLFTRKNRGNSTQMMFKHENLDMEKFKSNQFRPGTSSR